MERPFRFRAGAGWGRADSIVPANVIAIMWWGKMAGWPAFDGSILSSIDPKNTARLFLRPAKLFWGGRGKVGGKICWKNCRVCRARFFRGRLEEHRTTRIEKEESLCK